LTNSVVIISWANAKSSRTPSRCFGQCS